MSRVIKFRAYNSILGEMVPMTTDRHLYDLGNSNGWSVMQYTGLKDKNGVQIFESDVLKYEHPNTPYEQGGECVGVVEYVEDVCSFRVVALNGEENPIHGDIMLEKIGNIHESPELLEE